MYEKIEITVQTITFNDPKDISQKERSLLIIVNAWDKENRNMFADTVSCIEANFIPKISYRKGKIEFIVTIEVLVKDRYTKNNVLEIIDILLRKHSIIKRSSVYTKLEKELNKQEL